MQIQQTHVIRCLTHLHHFRLTLSRGFRPIRESDEMGGETAMDELAGVDRLKAGQDLYQIVLSNR